MRAVTYCRFSTDRQDSRSIEDRDRRCREFAGRNGLFRHESLRRRRKVWRDDGSRGASAPAPGRDQEEVPATSSSSMISLGLSSRPRRYLGESSFQDLAAANVRVVDVETGRASDEDSRAPALRREGPPSPISTCKAVRRQTHRGLEGRALAGFHTGGRTFGWRDRHVEKNPPDPEHPRRIPVVDQAEAAIVQASLRAVHRRQVAARDRPTS